MTREEYITKISMVVNLSTEEVEEVCDNLYQVYGIVPSYILELCLRIPHLDSYSASEFSKLIEESYYYYYTRVLKHIKKKFEEPLRAAYLSDSRIRRELNSNKLWYRKFENNKKHR